MNANAPVTGLWTAAMATAAVILLAVSSRRIPSGRALSKSDRRLRPRRSSRLAPEAPRNRVMPTSPNRLYIPSMTLSWLIYTAYGDGGFNTAMRVTGGPDWVNRTTFAVEGVASANATPLERRLMLQRLVEQRFALKLRTDITSVDMNVLVVDRRDSTLGPKVTEWTAPARTGSLRRKMILRCRAV